MHSEAELRHVSPRETTLVGNYLDVEAPGWEDAHPQVPLPVIDYDGTRYVRVDRIVGGGDSAPLDPQDLKAWLGGGDLGRYTEIAASKTFSGTPVQALTTGLPGDEETLSRGAAIAWDTLRDVRHDGRAEAGAALAGHLARDVLLVGNELYRRFLPLVRFHPWMDGHVSSVELSPVLHQDRKLPGHVIPFTADRLNEARALYGVNPTDTLMPGVREAVRLVPEGGFGEDGTRLVVRRLAVTASNWLEPAERALRKSGGETDHVRSLAERLRPYQMRARIGSLAEDDHHEAARLAREAIATVLDSGALPAGEARLARDRLRYLDDLALPKLRDTLRVDADDTSALGGLAP